MARFLLRLVVVIFYIIQAQGDLEEKDLTVEYDSDIQEKLNKISDQQEKAELKRLFKSMFKKGHAKGHAKGYATGYATGHASAEGATFLSSFECATHGLKRILETSYKRGNECISSDVMMKCEGLKIPKDILDIITNNDRWVRTYNPKQSKKKTTLENKVTICSLDKSTSVTDVPTSIDKYTTEIQNSFETWYGLLTLEFEIRTMPMYIRDLQTALQSFYTTNAAHYETIKDVHVRFAAHMARSFEMMCALHHQLNNIMKSEAERHREQDFLEILFKFASEWHMSQEQFEFLNILRQIMPNKLRSFKYIFVENGKHQWVVVPYDHSKDCGRLMFKDLSSTPKELTTLITIVPGTYPVS